MNGELVEAVARVIDDTYDVDCGGEMLNLDDIARAVIPVVQAHERERCAKVADSYMDEPRWTNLVNMSVGATASHEIAAAIRGLGE